MARQETLDDGTVVTYDRYAQFANTGEIVVVIESITDPDGVNGSWILVPEGAGWGPGWVSSDGGLTAIPPVPPVEPPKPYLHFIDLGPFNDRFGVKKLAVLMSADPIIKAFNSDKSDRHWVDLERADVRAAVGYMAGIPLTIAPGQTVTITTPILTQEEMDHVLNLTVATTEQLALIKNYFS